MLDEFMEVLKSHIPISLLYIIPITVLLTSVGPTSVSGSQEFSVFRLQHFDLYGSPYGSRNALINVEARPNSAAAVTRRCIISRLAEITSSRVRELAEKNAGGLLILLPQDPSSLSEDDTASLHQLEKDLVFEESVLPIYFAFETPELSALYNDVQSGGAAESAKTATEALFSTAFANGVQVMAGSTPNALSDFQIGSLQGALVGNGMVDELPTVVITAHYDAFAASPSLAYGADSNGSGVAALMELARIFSRLYTNSRTHTKYNLLFLLGGGGKFNYQGTKRWIDEHKDNADSGLLNKVAFVLCLDTIGSSDKLYAHVSKPPKDNSSSGVFQQLLFQEAQREGVQIEQRHKKINLREDLLAWEHERFSIRRLPAFTLSRLESHKDPWRGSLLDTRARVDSAVLTRNTRIISNALARFIYGLHEAEHSDKNVFSGSLMVEKESLNGWLDVVTATPRAAQLVRAKGSGVLATLQQGMQRYLKEVSVVTTTPDKRDPDFIFYDVASAKMTAYTVKPAIFDLFLGMLIAAYVGLIYALVLVFPSFYAKFSQTAKAKPYTNGKLHKRD